MTQLEIYFLLKEVIDPYFRFSLPWDSTYYKVLRQRVNIAIIPLLLCWV